MSKIGSASPLGTTISGSELDATVITGQTAEATADNADLILIYDNSASALKKMTRANFTSGLGGGSFPALTAGALTVVSDGSDGRPFVASWAVADVNALGAVTTGNIKVATLPAKTLVRNVLVRVTTAEGSLATFTISVGRTAAAYIDYVVASDGQAALAIYGNASAERGTNATGYDLPSYTATTDVFVQFVSSGGNLNAADLTAGLVVIDYSVIP